MNIVGLILIGVLTWLAGFPIYYNGNFSIKNVLIVMGCTILWQLVWFKVEKK